MNIKELVMERVIPTTRKLPYIHRVINSMLSYQLLDWPGQLFSGETFTMY